MSPEEAVELPNSLLAVSLPLHSHIQIDSISSKDSKSCTSFKLSHLVIFLVFISVISTGLFWSGSPIINVFRTGFQAPSLLRVDKDDVSALQPPHSKNVVEPEAISSLMQLLDEEMADDAPQYVSLFGQIFDVTSHKSLFIQVRPLQRWSIDLTRYFAMSSMVPQDSSSLPLVFDHNGQYQQLTLEDLSPREIKLAERWLTHFRLNYPFIGVLSGSFFESSGNPTPLLIRLKALLRRIHLIDAASVPTSPNNLQRCEATWLERSGGVFWCKQQQHRTVLALYNQLEEAEAMFGESTTPGTQAGQQKQRVETFSTMSTPPPQHQAKQSSTDSQKNAMKTAGQQDDISQAVRNSKQRDRAMHVSQRQSKHTENDDTAGSIRAGSISTRRSKTYQRHLRGDQRATQQDRYQVEEGSDSAIDMDTIGGSATAVKPLQCDTKDNVFSEYCNIPHATDNSFAQSSTSSSTSMSNEGGFPLNFPFARSILSLFTNSDNNHNVHDDDDASSHTSVDEQSDISPKMQSSLPHLVHIDELRQAYHTTTMPIVYPRRVHSAYVSKHNVVYRFMEYIQQFGQHLFSHKTSKYASNTGHTTTPPYAPLAVDLADRLSWHEECLCLTAKQIIQLDRPMKQPHEQLLHYVESITTEISDHGVLSPQDSMTANHLWAVHVGKQSVHGVVDDVIPYSDTNHPHTPSNSDFQQDVSLTSVLKIFPFRDSPAQFSTRDAILAHNRRVGQHRARARDNTTLNVNIQQEIVDKLNLDSALEMSTSLIDPSRRSYDPSLASETLAVPVDVSTFEQDNRQNSPSKKQQERRSLKSNFAASHPQLSRQSSELIGSSVYSSYNRRLVRSLENRRHKTEKSSSSSSTHPYSLMFELDDMQPVPGYADRWTFHEPVSFLAHEIQAGIFGASALDDVGTIMPSKRTKNNSVSHHEQSDVSYNVIRTVQLKDKLHSASMYQIGRNSNIVSHPSHTTDTSPLSTSQHSSFTTFSPQKTSNMNPFSHSRQPLGSNIQRNVAHIGNPSSHPVGEQSIRLVAPQSMHQRGAAMWKRYGLDGNLYLQFGLAAPLIHHDDQYVAAQREDDDDDTYVSDDFISNRPQAGRQQHQDGIFLMKVEVYDECDPDSMVCSV